MTCNRSGRACESGRGRPSWDRLLPRLRPATVPSRCALAYLVAVITKFSSHWRARRVPIVIVGIGIDVVTPERLERALAGHGGAFEGRVFTPGERAECASRADRAQALAARFAAKEACFKALGTGWGDGYGLQQVEVVTGPAGRPELRLAGGAAERARELGVRAIHVSLSHEPVAAAAVVVLEG